MTRRAYLRIAHPLTSWVWSNPQERAAALDELAADRKSWSIFLGDTIEFPRLVLASFYGWRSGPGTGPLYAVGYIAFEVSELEVTEGTVEHTPDKWTHRWPRELADAHHDLVGHTERGVRALVAAVNVEERIVQLSRPQLYLEQLRATRRNDCPTAFADLFAARMKKLAARERPVFEDVLAACRDASEPLPAV